MAHGEPVLYSLYVYAPNQGAPVFFAIAYAVSAVFHIWQCYRYKAFKMIGIHPACAIFFVAGYGLRIYGSRHYLLLNLSDPTLLVYIMSQVFIYICPPLLELANYEILARTFRYVPYLAPLQPDRVFAVFGNTMAIVEVLNALGVSLGTSPNSSPATQSLGRGFALASVGVQLILISTFYGFAGTFHRRCARANLWRCSRTIRVVLGTLYASMAFILARTIYRLTEHAGETRLKLDDIAALRALSPLLRYEVFFYIFEASFMLVNSVIWNVWHPGRFLPRTKNVYLGRNGVEVVRDNVVDARSVWAKIVFYLTFGTYFKPRDEPDPAAPTVNIDLQEQQQQPSGRQSRSMNSSGGGPYVTEPAGPQKEDLPAPSAKVNQPTL